MIEFLFTVVVETVCGATGHGLLWLATFGRWDAANGRDTEASLVGLVFWVLLGAAVWFAFFP